MHRLIFLFLLFSGVYPAMSTLSAQSSPAIVSGFDAIIYGAPMTYDSPLPWMRQALISRASDGASTMAWRSDPVSIPAGAERVRLAWFAGLGSNLGDYAFTLLLEEQPLCEFSTRDTAEWQIEGARGSRLAFRTIGLDRHNDRFGLMTLDLPALGLVRGQPLTLRITGAAARSNGWVMTFTAPVRQEFHILPATVIVRDKGHPVAVELLYLGEKGEAFLHSEGQPLQRMALHFGRNTQELFYPPVKKETGRKITLQIDGKRYSKTFIQKPVRPWTVYLVQHSHTDIGYTRSQAEILAEHLRYIDYALDFCDQTDDLPDDARFRWSCETSWAVREYLKNRPPAQIARLKRRIEEGRVEVTAQLFNWSELADENALLHSLAPVREFQDMGLPVQTAMQNDVNGYAWCLVDYFSTLGIKYVTSGINDARALKPFSLPTAFWWESPSGKRVLAFRADHYMIGNMLGLLAASERSFIEGLTRYLDGLEQKGYPHAEVSLQYSGYFTDNSPPSTLACERIRAWNDTYEWPKLRSATAHEFLNYISHHESQQLPVLRAAWPDWWTDGFGSAQRETAAGRAAQAGMIAHQGLLAMTRMAYGAVAPPLLSQNRAVMENINFWNEHTFGAAESISDPMAANSQVQWSEKSSYIWSAAMGVRLLRESALGYLQECIPPLHSANIVVFNTLNWARSGLHTVYIDNQLLPKEQAFRLLDESGRELAAQLAGSRPEGNYWAIWVEDIPPLGWRTFRIESAGAPPEAPAAFIPVDGLIENHFYRAEVDLRAGGLRSLLDKELNLELLDPEKQYLLGQMIFERLQDRRSLEELRLGEHSRTAWQEIRIAPGIDGPIWQSFIIEGAGEGLATEPAVRCEMRFYKQVKRIELFYSGRKLPVTEPEGLYVAFPFALEDGRLVFEAQGGLVSPGIDQIEGTATDWNTVQNFAALRNRRAQIVLVSDEIPLMQFGAINTGRYHYGAKPASGQIFSWVLNNYWSTNFRASQEGEISWSYALTSGADVSNASASRFGWASRVPLVSRVRPAVAGGSAAVTGRTLWPFVPGGAESLLLVNARVDDEGIIFHLREVEGRSSTLRFSPPGSAWKIELCDPLGRPAGELKEVVFAPFEVKFIRLRSKK